MDGRRVTDFQRIVIYFSTVTAVFLAAMGLGWQNLWLLLTAVGVLVVAVVGVIVVVTRRSAGAHEIATAQVISVSSPPPNVGIAAKCDMLLEIQRPGRPPVRTRHRDPAVPLTRWPQPGQTFPVDVANGNPRRHVRIRWDMVEQGLLRAPDGTRQSGSGPSKAPMWEEENEPIVYSPTPPRPRRPQTPPPPPSTSSTVDTQTPASEAAVFVHETFTDVDEVPSASAPQASPEGTPRVPPSSPVHRPVDAPPSPTHRTAGADTNGHDPDGFDPADFETPRLTTVPPPAATGGPGFEAVTLSEFDPADVDIRDFTGEPPAVTAMPADDGEPRKPARSSAAEAPPTIPLPRDPIGAARGGTGISASRPVADLARSMRFYRDALGFGVAHEESTWAVVEHQGNRVLLTQHRESPVSGEIIIGVTDLEASCAAAQEHAGAVVEPPTQNGGERRRARLRDPDGHVLALVESPQRGE